MLTFAIAYYLLLPFSDHLTLWTYSIAALLACAIQLLFCFKLRRAAAKLIPLFLLLAESAVCGIYLVVVTGWDALTGLIGLIAAGTAAVGIAAAWIIFAVVRCVRRRKIDT